MCSLRYLGVETTTGNYSLASCAVSTSKLGFEWCIHSAEGIRHEIVTPLSPRALQEIYLPALHRLPLKLERGARSSIYLPFPYSPRTLQEIYPSGLRSNRCCDAAFLYFNSCYDTLLWRVSARPATSRPRVIKLPWRVPTPPATP